jgi:hypothetical protein
LGGNISKKFPPKAEDLFYVVRVPPLKLQHTQQCLMENHKKGIKREISQDNLFYYKSFTNYKLQEITTNVFPYHAKLHMVLTGFRPYDSQDIIIYTNVGGEPELPQFNILKNHFSKLKLEPELQFNATQLANLTQCNYIWDWSPDATEVFKYNKQPRPWAGGWRQLMGWNSDYMKQIYVEIFCKAAERCLLADFSRFT